MSTSTTNSSIDISKIRPGDTVTVHRIGRIRDAFVTGVVEESDLDGALMIRSPRCTMVRKPDGTAYRDREVVAHTPLKPEWEYAKIIRVNGELYSASSRGWLLAGSDAGAYAGWELELLSTGPIEIVVDENGSNVEAVLTQRCEELSIQVTNLKLDNEDLGERLTSLDELLASKRAHIRDLLRRLDTAEANADVVVDLREQLKRKESYIRTLNVMNDNQAQTIRDQREEINGLVSQIKAARGALR